LHEDQVISAPRALRVSMRTAVWMAVEEQVSVCTQVIAFRFLDVANSLM
jgi:hypothetical protein